MYAAYAMSNVMDSIDEEAFDGYMVALSQCTIDPKFDGVILRLYPNGDRYEVIRLVEETFDTICRGQMDDSHPSYIAVRYDDPAIACLIYKALK